MAAAIGRVQGQAGALGSQIQGIRRDSAALVGDLKRVDSEARAAAETLMRYRRTVEEGKTLPETGWADTTALKEFILNRTAAAGAGDVGRAFVTQFERELGATMPGRAPAAAAPSGPRIQPAAPRTSPPPSSPAAAPPASPAPAMPTSPVSPPSARDDAGGGTGQTWRKAADVLGDPTPPRWPADAPRRKAADVIKARRDIDAQFKTDANEQINLTNLKRRDLVTDRDLQRSWREGTKTLRDHSKELQQAQRELGRFESYQRIGAQYPHEPAVIDRLRLRVGALRDAIQETSGRQGQIAAEWQRRGYSVRGDGLSMARGPAGPMRQFVGGLGGGIAGGAGGNLLNAGIAYYALGGGPGALAAAVGLAVGSFASRSAETREQTQRAVFGAGMRLGSFRGLRSMASAGLHGPLHLQFSESLGAMTALAMQTGATDAGGISALARAYGLPVEATAQIIGQMGALGVMPKTSVERRRIQIPGSSMARPGQPLMTSPSFLSTELTRGRWGGAGRSWDAQPSLLSRAGDFASGLFRYMTSSDPFNGPGTRPADSQSRNRLVEFLRPPDPWKTPTGGYAAARARLNGGGDRVVEIRHGRGLPEMIAGAYQGSAYGGRGGNNALMSAFLEQSGRLMQIQGSGGAPIMDFERMPAMLSAASNVYGPDVNPAFGAKLAGGIAQGIQQPQGDVLRGVALRAVMSLGRTLSPEQLDKFQNDPKIRKMTGGAGMDLRSYFGAMAAMQNAFALPREQGQQVIQAIVGAYRGLAGGPGTAASQGFFTNMFGGKAALGLSGDLNLEKLISAEGGKGGGDLVGQFKDLFDKSGEEGNPFMNDARWADLETAIGGPLKQLGQGITKAVLDFADDIREAHTVWESGVPMSQAAGQSGGGGFGQ